MEVGPPACSVEGAGGAGRPDWRRICDKLYVNCVYCGPPPNIYRISVSDIDTNIGWTLI